MTSIEQKMRRDLWRVTLRQLWLTPRTGFSNVRFLVGMWVGGFARATRDTESVG